MLTDTQRHAAADALDQVATTKTPVPLFSRAHPDMTLIDSYAIQALWSELREARGDRRVGYKVGLTSRAMQTLLKVDSPQIGRLHASQVYRDGARIPAARFLKPSLEVEIAFIMGEDLEGPGVQPHDVLRATQYIRPALELIDYRTETPRLVTDMVADNTAAAGAIFGGQYMAPDRIDLRWISAILTKNGAIEETGVTAAVLGHPANSVAVLANMLAADGLGLVKGDVVLTGSFTRQVYVQAGDVIHADFGPLGAFAVSFV